MSIPQYAFCCSLVKMLHCPSLPPRSWMYMCLKKSFSWKWSCGVLHEVWVYNVLLCSAWLQMCWASTASGSSLAWTVHVSTSCVPSCCRSWTLAPAGHIRRRMVATPPPGHQTPKVSEALEKLLKQSDNISCTGMFCLILNKYQLSCLVAECPPWHE